MCILLDCFSACSLPELSEDVSKQVTVGYHGDHVTARGKFSPFSGWSPFPLVWGELEASVTIRARYNSIHIYFYPSNIS